MRGTKGGRMARNIARGIGSLVLAMTISLCLNAQNLVLIDSLRKQFSAASPEKRFTLLNTIGFEYRYSYPDSTIEYCNKAYALGRSLHLKKDLSKSLSFIGLANANKGDFRQSVKYHYEAIDVAIEQNDSSQLGFGYNNLGRMFFDEGDLARSYTNLSRSKELFEALHNRSGLAYVYRSLANIYKSQHDFGQALEMSERAYALRIELGDLRAIVSALTELGLVYEDLNNGERALEKFRTADSLVARVHDKVTQAEVKMGLAEILFHHKEYEESYQTATAVLHVVTILTNQKLFLRAQLIRARYFCYKGNDEEAVPVLLSLIRQAENNLSFKREACFLLSGIYAKQNNTTLANEYKNEYEVLDQKLQNTNLTMQVSQLQFKLELEKIEKENEVLKVNQAKDKALISTQQTQNILLLLTVVSVSVVVFLLWLDSRRRRKIQQQLEQQNKQIVHQGEEIETKNRDLSQRNAQLSALNHEKDTVMNIVAHDLKAPINQIFGIARLIQMEGELNPQQKAYIDLIQSATNSGLDLIVDLLDVSELQESNEHLKYGAFEWSNFVKERIYSFEPVARAKGILIQSTGGEFVTVISERGYISRIFDNLISNAIKFSPRGSVIVVATEIVNGSAEIRVRDQGPGFREADKPFLFQRFRKLSARPTAGESSNGLGLAIVKTLVDRLGGQIELITAADRGSEFIVTVPVKVAEKSAL